MFTQDANGNYMGYNTRGELSGNVNDAMTFQLFKDAHKEAKNIMKSGNFESKFAAQPLVVMANLMSPSSLKFVEQ